MTLVAVNYLWDPDEDNIVKELDDAGNTIADHTTVPFLYGDVISQHRGGQSRFYHYDAQGSTLAVTDDNQNVTDTFAYTAFGEVTERTGTTDVPFQYIGQKGYYTDSVTGQIMARRRPYDPVRARWLSRDPVAGFARIDKPVLSTNAAARSAFEYGRNNPVHFTDPKGTTAIPGPWEITIYSPPEWEELLRGDTDPSPHPLKGYEVAIPDVPECDEGCKPSELKTEPIDDPGKHVATYQKTVTQQCVRYHPGVRAIGKPVGEHYFIYERKATLTLRMYFAKMRWRVVCIKEGAEPCNTDASDATCSDKLSAVFGPIMYGTVKYKPWSDWLRVSDRIGGPPPKDIPHCKL